MVRPDTVIGEDPVPVNPPGEDVAVYVTVPAPKLVGAVNVTLADAGPAVAVPIVGAPGLRGHVPAADACMFWDCVQTPLAADVLVVGAVALITPPL